MKYLPLFLILFFLIGCSNVSNDESSSSASNIQELTIHDLLVDNGDQISENPYLVEDKYNGQMVYLKAKLVVASYCSSPSKACVGGCDSECKYGALLTDDVDFPSDISSRGLKVKFDGEYTGVFEDSANAFYNINCGFPLEEDTTYLFKGIPEVREYKAASGWPKLYWTGYFNIEECEKI